MDSSFVKDMVLWYNANRRDLPWRHTRDPYSIYVSEIMLQQTRVEAVRGYYRSFLKRLPTVSDLAVCPDDELMKLWEGLGYYSRVRHMKEAALIVEKDYGGRFPSTYAGIRALPGIGSYTAGAVGSIAFGLREPAVDGNVLRVLSRYEGSREDVLSARVKRAYEEKLRSLLNRDEVKSLEESQGEMSLLPGSFNQSLIELGALICVPKRPPSCSECPLKSSCRAFRDHLTEELPVRIKKTARKVEERTVLLIRSGMKTAIIRRPEKGLLAGLYEFPNTKGFLTSDEAVHFVEGLGYEALHIRKITDSAHLFSHVEWKMTGYEIRITQDFDGGPFFFADESQIQNQYAIPSAFRAYADYLAVQVGKKGKA